MSTSPDTGFIGVWSKLTMLVRVARGGWGKESWGWLSYTQIPPSHVLSSSYPNKVHFTRQKLNWYSFCYRFFAYMNVRHGLPINHILFCVFTLYLAFLPILLSIIHILIYLLPFLTSPISYPSISLNFPHFFLTN